MRLSYVLHDQILGKNQDVTFDILCLRHSRLY